MTEQGEVLSTRYHDPDLAFRIIEQMAYGVLLGAEAAQKEAQVPETWCVAMTEMSKLAYRAYDSLVHQDPEFIEFWRTATPIEEISGLKLGSRPTFRNATQSIDDLRAIPSVSYTHLDVYKRQPFLVHRAQKFRLRGAFGGELLERAAEAVPARENKAALHPGKDPGNGP